MSSSRDFDPRTRAFSDEELKPQPMIKKSRKQFVPDDLKDDKYWARRRKNNMAAKRSRDARRMKENQIALRAGYLEKEVVYFIWVKITNENKILILFLHFLCPVAANLCIWMSCTIYKQNVNLILIVTEYEFTSGGWATETRKSGTACTPVKVSRFVRWIP